VKLLNSAMTVMGNYAYHEAALRGNCRISPNPCFHAIRITYLVNPSINILTDEIIDLLLDQEGFECDPINIREGDTPLHSAVRWVNSLHNDQLEEAIGLVEMMLEAGSDPRSAPPFLSNGMSE
jgi:hypothetical protein